MPYPSRTSVSTALMLACLATASVLAAEFPEASQWLSYGNDAGGARHSAATQITPDNVDKLEPAWTYRTGEDYSGGKQAGRATFQATPLLIDGVLYLSTPSTRVIALRADSGEELWVFDPGIDTESHFFPSSLPAASPTGAIRITATINCSWAQSTGACSPWIWPPASSPRGSARMALWT